MRADHARELRRALVDARALAAALGLQVAPRSTPRQAMARCPWHADATPSCSIRLAKDGTLAVRCHGCGETGDALTLIAQARGLDDFRETLRVAAELANAPALAPVEAEPKPHAEPALTDERYDGIACALLDACGPLRDCPDVARYLDGRGIYADADAAGVRGLPRDCVAHVASLLAVFERADLERAGVVRRGHDAIDWPAWLLCIPWRDRFGRVTCIQRRRLDDGEPRYRFPPGRAPRAPFGVDLLPSALDVLGPAGEVAIVEGALDALARRRIARHRGEPCAVIGVQSASSPCVGLPLDLLAGRRVVLALDDDERGEEACGKLAAELEGVAHKMVRQRPPLGFKDWASALEART